VTRADDLSGKAVGPLAFVHLREIPGRVSRSGHHTGRVATRRWQVMIVTSVAAFMSFLDVTIVRGLARRGPTEPSSGPPPRTIAARRCSAVHALRARTVRRSRRE